MNIVTTENICPKRLASTRASIRLRWEAAGHRALTTLTMHSAYRTLGVPKEQRPRTVQHLRGTEEKASIVVHVW